ncbi:hypothetical protein HY642_01885 [Candidatus Woesearchaeota archaeon]|nr:hypothetical protein [Candidatus Woesearchaeota archaeon]
MTRLAWALLAAAILLAGLHAVHFAASPEVIGKETYYHHQMAEEWKSGLPREMYGPRPYVFQPYHLLLMPFEAVLGFKLAAVVVPLILGVLGLMLFSLVASALTKTESAYALLVLVASPVFIAVSLQSTPASLNFVLLCVYAYAVVRQRWLHWVGGIALVILSLSSVYWFAFAAVLSLFFLSKLRRRDLSVPVALVLLAGISYYVPFLLRFGMPKGPPVSANVLAGVLTDFGSTFGLSIFLLVLLGIAFILARDQRVWLYATLGIIVAAAFHHLFVLPATIAVALLSGIALSRLASMKWEYRELRTLALLALLCGLLFSTLSFGFTIAGTYPDAAMAQALRQLPSGAVLSHESNGFWIEKLSHNQAVIDEGWEFMPAERYPDVQRIWQSRNLTATTQLLDKYNVSTILITQSMRNGQVWKSPEEGLLFVLGNRDAFTQTINGTVEVWEYKRQTST